MAAQNSWVGDGSTTDFQFNFQYLKAADIKASLTTNSFRNVYPSVTTAGLTYNATAKTLTGLGTIGGNDRAYMI